MTSNLKTIIWNTKDFEVKKHSWLISVSYIEESQARLLHIFFGCCSSKKNLFDSTVQTTFGFPPCVLCDAENIEGAGLLLTEGLTKSIEGSFLNVTTEGGMRKGEEKREKQSQLCSPSNKRYGKSWHEESENTKGLLSLKLASESPTSYYGYTKHC